MVSFGGPLAGGYMIYRNYKIFGEHHKARMAMVVCALITLTLVQVVLRLDGIIIDIPTYLLPAINSSVAYWFLHKYQESKIKAHKAGGGKTAGWGITVVISLVGAFLTVAPFIAIMIFKSSLDYNFDDTERLTINQDNAHLHREGLELAIADYGRAIEVDPNDTEAYFNRAIAYYLKQDFDRAVADFSRVIEVDSNNAEAYHNRGAAYFSKNDFDRAIADLSRAIEIEPDNSKLYSSRGAAHFAKKDIDAAIADYGWAIEINPNDSKEAYLWRGIIYFDKGDFDRAATDFEAVLRIDPDDAFAKGRLENIRLLRGIGF
jgi:tetratricopeptide (TPR) repeat protein